VDAARWPTPPGARCLATDADAVLPFARGYPPGSRCLATDADAVLPFARGYPPGSRCLATNAAAWVRRCRLSLDRMLLT
jgi:hypothetical protein